MTPQHEDIRKEARDLRSEIRGELLKLAGMPRVLRRPMRWAMKRMLAVLEWVERESGR